ncbi:hypothetical protein [Paeniglutamicibacter terrestris]|uniref:Asp23/Gls24 family envelope stress response protein n=1 Tax=Paeniglutamicibacter terrestris TaxID=2723403 RepID=A0ABX1G1Q9_9MICC|nr:hypothetical protein [Paeniglutamicibacter terrestris]ASN38246.1 hypothetical protein CGQ24_03940 [Arthrobacter sp. 7749]NKG19541.1 hypothetical protein [Paeniglutamicibacter terrestris]
MEVRALPENPYSCERTEDELWSKLSEPADEHEQGCPNCQAQRKRLATLSLAAGQWSAETDSEADEELLGGLLDRVMDRVRTEVRRGVRFTIRITPHGPLMISGYLLLETLRDAVDQLPYISLGSHKILPGELPDTISLSLKIAIEAGQDGTALAQQAREALLTHFAERIGISLGAIDISVEDVIHEH